MVGTRVAIFFFSGCWGVCVVVGWWVDVRGSGGVCIDGGDCGIARFFFGGCCGICVVVGWWTSG